MLRHVSVDGASKADAAELFGVSRPTFIGEVRIRAMALPDSCRNCVAPRAHTTNLEVMAFAGTTSRRRRLHSRPRTSRATGSRAGHLGPPRSIRTRDCTQNRRAIRRRPSPRASPTAAYEALRDAVTEACPPPRGCGGDSLSRHAAWAFHACDDGPAATTLPHLAERNAWAHSPPATNWYPSVGQSVLRTHSSSPMSTRAVSESHARPLAARCLSFAAWQSVTCAAPSRTPRVRNASTHYASAPYRWAGPSNARTLSTATLVCPAQAAEHRRFPQQLVSEVANAVTPASPGLEVSRLARNNADRHQLIEPAALTHTLILDEDASS